MGYEGPQFWQKFLPDTQEGDFLIFLHLWVISKSSKRWGLYKSLSIYISASKSCRDTLEPSLEPPNIALSVPQLKKVFAHIRHTKFSTFKILDIFEEIFKKILFRQKFLSVWQKFLPELGTFIPQNFSTNIWTFEWHSICVSITPRSKVMT